MDDGSTDGTGRLCDEFAASDPRARVIHHPENRGLWAARNTGQDAATGEYLWFPDGDDYFRCDTIRLLYEAINSNGVYYDVALMGFKRTESINETVLSQVDPIEYFELSQERMVKNLFALTTGSDYFEDGVMWNKLFRKSLIYNIRTVNYNRTQDWDFCFRAYLNIRRGIFMNKVLYYWYQRPGSLTHSSEHSGLFYYCRRQMMYNNVISLPNDKVEYKHYLLYALYKYLVALPEINNQFVLSNRTIIKNTWRDYLLCRNISFIERVSRLLMARFPLLSHLIYYVRRMTASNKRLFKKPA